MLRCSCSGTSETDTEELFFKIVFQFFAMQSYYRNCFVNYTLYQKVSVDMYLDGCGMTSV